MTTQNVVHPGLRIKTEVIPRGMSVTKAAELTGVGRPALSNLLNGKAALSAEMAARLEKAFKYPLKNLMEMQAQYEAARAKEKAAPSDAKAYVPPFLAIKANAIEEWVDHNIQARSRLAVFLRTLVHSTGLELTKVDFPGNDDAERSGWDGFVEAGAGTPWIPSGLSGWEFGTSEDPRTKANGDFEKSVAAIDENVRVNTTFVFVTPRRWAGKTAWVSAKRAELLWQDVRAYDASDLEQWLEQSLSAQAWFANETHGPAQEVRSLDKCWADWADVSTPPLASALFESAIQSAKRTVASCLTNSPERPIVIAADSTEEALAFLAQLLSAQGGDELASVRDRVIVFDKPGVLPRLTSGRQTFIPVVFTREVERELAPLTRSMHSFVIYPRNAAITNPDVVLEPVSYQAFNSALEGMGKSRDEITSLAKASGRSLTVLRRRLSSVQAVQLPEWAADFRAATKLVPFLFVGAWDSRSEADKIGLSLLASDRPYEELEKDCQSLAKLNDAPVWLIGSARGVISKLDLLYAVAHAVTEADLVSYFDIARMVLGEDDPTLDLDESQRWTASLDGKVREFSGTFREGISETLVLLAVHGNELFRGRFSFDIEAAVTHVVRDLLQTPLTTRALEANDRDLPTYAEAAPDEFLSIIERDLRTDSPAVFGLLRPVSPGVFGASPTRTGLLWALEGLSWSPTTLPRAAAILARLSQIEINDNWVNKPANSLGAIFRAWMPQTAANLQQRVDLLKQLKRKYPDAAWKVCIAQLNTHSQVGDYSHKPRWRPDGYGYGEPFPTRGPVQEFVREVVELTLGINEYSMERLSDLVHCLQALSESDQARVWKLVENWAKDQASDSDKAVMREKIRISTLSRRAALRAKRDGGRAVLAAAGKAAYDALEPSDLLNKHAWLFRNAWVEESADELEDLENSNYDKRNERINRLRVEALREVFERRGLLGILEISERGNAPWVVGSLAASVLLSESELLELLHLALGPVLSEKEDVHPHKSLIGAAICAETDNDKRNAILRRVAVDRSEDDAVTLLLLAPFGKSTWNLVDTLSETAQSRYWSEMPPEWVSHSEAERNEAIERLLKAERPRAAFSSIRHQLNKVDAMTIFRLMSEIAQGGKDLPEQHLLEPYYVEQAFNQVNGCSSLSLEQKAGLEFAYIDVLGQLSARREESNIPNLERYVELHPELYTQAICWVYKRKDGATDPADYQVPTDRLSDMAKRGYRLMQSISRLPGQDESGDVDEGGLMRWIEIVRRSCNELSRAEIADVCIGRLLSIAPVGKDGIWPCESVRTVMEDIQSEPMMDGACTGTYNSRGVHWRGAGGEQERELAERYRAWGEALQFSHPFVASKLLMSVAKTYDHQAVIEDAEEGIRRRLQH
ncbi:addiction module antidote protein, HigA family [Pseudomonas neustonica]|uniref:Addiction module antidote protein, HigA family n=1 Tax=Pseudomonas neustonica TaxID=2487346 RepID=A0ABX9XEZ3_9PSED|nr:MULTISPECIES: HigA family addiction module antitoxin [Pseudomonas]ROZ79287.1 addiction module antidote protein, HigA family [Pseudomonas sp. SSM44]ROZ80217.1 addiction module antidote protein, HigA family [Pseudomonas neustonica]